MRNRKQHEEQLPPPLEELEHEDHDLTVASWLNFIRSHAAKLHRVPEERKDKEPRPTAAIPGTPEKQEVLAERRRLGQWLYHPRDAKFGDIDASALTIGEEGNTDDLAHERDARDANDEDEHARDFWSARPSAYGLVSAAG